MRHTSASLLIVLFVGSLAAQSAPKINQIAELTASDGARDDSFGSSVAIGKNVIAVGAPDKQSALGGDGVGYVFIKPTSGWANATQTAELTSTDFTDGMTASISTNGNIVVAGAPVIGTDELQSEADVFVEPVGGWQNMTQTARLTPISSYTSEGFGSSAAIGPSGREIFIGQPLTYSGLFNGAVYLYNEPTGEWQNTAPSGTLIGPPSARTFGSALATDGSVLVVSDSFANSSKGVVYVYTRTGGATPIATLTASDATEGDYFGTSVAYGDGTIAVGAPGHAGTGAAYVFVVPPGGWTNMTQTAELTLAEVNAGAEVGQGVAILNHIIAIGGPNAEVGGNENQGLIAAYRKPPGGWTNMTESFLMLASDGASNDLLGYSVAADNGVIVGGAYGKNNYQGVVYVFGTQ